MKRRAYAKINLALNVLGVRADGYHEIESLMVPIDFYDELTITIAARPEFKANRDYVTNDKQNTIYKAIAYLRNKYRFQENFRIILNKQIPSRAGLGGGSCDGAMTILMLDQLLALNLSEAEKKAAACAIGADVPFCLKQTPAIVKGIGEIVEPCPCLIDPYILLVKPYFGISTKEAYNNLALNQCAHPLVQQLKEALALGDYESFINSLGNSLEEAAFKLEPRIKTIKEELLTLGFDAALMSGSGSTVMGFTTKEKLITEALPLMRKKGYFVRKTRIYQASKPK